MAQPLENLGDEIVGNLSDCLLLLNQVFLVISIISMIIFACVDGPNGEDPANKDKCGDGGGCGGGGGGCSGGGCGGGCGGWEQHCLQPLCH